MDEEELLTEKGADLNAPDVQLALMMQTANRKRGESDKKTIERLQKLLRQAKHADDRWRKRAEEGMAYYDGDQWREGDKRVLEGRRQAPVTINRIAPTIDLVVGLQVTQPIDWVAKPVGMQDDGVAEAATAALKTISIQNDVFDKVIEAYKFSLTYGVGWLAAGFFIRDPDPRSEPVQVIGVDPREIRYDPQAKQKDLSDARFMVWSRKVDIEDAMRAYPKLKRKVKSGYGEGVEYVAYEDSSYMDEGSYKIYEGPIDIVPPPSLWDSLDYNEAYKEDYDRESEMIYVHEFWEKSTKESVIVEHKNGWVQILDLDKQDELQTLFDPSIKRFYVAPVPFMRYYVFTGDVMLVNEDSPYTHNKFPFVPVWHKRDRHGDPLSMVEMLKDPQREINHRRSRLLWELISNSVRISQKAFAQTNLSMEEVQIKAARPDAVWIGDSGDIEMLPRPGQASGQFQLMNEAKQEIQSVSGINDDLMGFDSSSRSGKAKQITMIQGATIQRPKEKNLHIAHKLLGEIVLQLIQQAHTDEWLVRITDDIEGEKFININAAQMDEMGNKRVLNDITQARFDLIVEEAPWTPTQRDRAFEMLTRMAEAEPDPIMRQTMHQAALMVGDIPNKTRIMGLVQQAGQAMVQQAQQAQQMKMAQAQADLAAQDMSAVGPQTFLPPGAKNPVSEAVNTSPAVLQGLLDPATMMGD
jgi:hypothetical protein